MKKSHIVKATYEGSSLTFCGLIGFDLSEQPAESATCINCSTAYAAAKRREKIREEKDNVRR